MRGETPEGFVDLFDREFERLVRSLRTIDDDAADAVQEAFIQALVRWNRVGQLEDPAGWVRRVAMNRLLNSRRARRRRDALHRRAPEPAEPGDSNEILDVRAAVRQLPPRQQAAVTLHYGGDLSIREVSEALDVSEGTIKSQLSDARATLRRLLLHLRAR